MNKRYLTFLLFCENRACPYFPGSIFRVKLLARRLIIAYNVLESTFKVPFSLHMDNKPVKGEYLEVLLRSPKTVFSTKDVALLWGEEKEQTVSGRLKNMLKPAS